MCYIKTCTFDSPLFPKLFSWHTVKGEDKSPAIDVGFNRLLSSSLETSTRAFVIASLCETVLWEICEVYFSNDRHYKRLCLTSLVLLLRQRHLVDSSAAADRSESVTERPSVGLSGFPHRRSKRRWRCCPIRVCFTASSSLLIAWHSLSTVK